jgi:hypothetical protein
MIDQSQKAGGRLSRIGGTAAALLSVAFALSGGRSQAATISVIHDRETATVTVDGELTPDDGINFRQRRVR